MSDNENTIRLLGGGPDCPKCGGPTYKVGEDGGQPWWCPDPDITNRDGCNLRVADDGTARGYDG